jgi:hypothetical protein
VVAGGRVRYDAVVNGLVLTQNLLAVAWEHTTREVAERGVVEVALHPTRESRALEAMGNGAHLLIRADGVERFEGRVEEVVFTEKRPVTIQLTAFSSAFDLGASEDDVDFPEGHTPQDVIAYLTAAFGLAFPRVDWPSLALARQPYRQKTLAYMVEDVNRKLRLKGQGDFYLRTTGRTHEIVAPGPNAGLYVLDAGNSEVMTDRASTKDMVTQAKVVGVAFGLGSVPQATRPRVIENPTAPPGTWGVRQRLIYEKDAGTDEQQREAADAIFDALGTPTRVKLVQSPDVPEIRKGDAVIVQVGTASGRHIVTGVHHDGKAGTMQLEFDTTGQNRRRVVTTKPSISFPELTGPTFVPESTP